MADADIPHWLKNIPMAPEYRPTETEFVDPIAFISRIEREAAAFGICKVIPPIPKPSKKFVLSNLKRSLSKSPELGDAAAATSSSVECACFTTRQQELGSRRSRPALPKQVWQSGEAYTLDQFEAKSKAFARSQLGGFKEVTPLLVESLFWKAVTEKPIYTEYANDVPGSGFAVPEENLSYISRRRIRKRGFLRRRVNEEKCGFRLMDLTKDGQPQKDLESGSCGEGREGSSGWKLSNSRWNLQVVARSPGSLTRFMPDDVPGVTSPMVYIGMLFSWFAWHVEDHELHSMNFLHMGSSKTWYAVPGDHAATLEEIVRVQGYGGNVDRLAAFIMLGEKTTLLSPEVLVASSVPVCRLVQHPGEFVVTFPRAYHVGFSHGFNCGEAANFATPQWLKVAKEAAIRRAAMNLLPMLSHQQLLYILTMSFVTRVPRNLISGARSSRLRDRRKEEREFLVRKAFLTDMINENNLLCILLAKETNSSPILWEPDMLHRTSSVSQPHSCTSLEVPGSDQNGFGDQHNDLNSQETSCMVGGCCIEKPAPESTSFHEPSFGDSSRNGDFITSEVEALEVVEDEGDLPVGLNVDSGSLACVACGILGYPFMAIIQPSQKASRAIFPINSEKLAKTDCLNSPSCFQNDACGPASGERCTKLAEQSSLDGNCEFSQTCNSSLKAAGCKISHSENSYPSLDYLSTSSLGNKTGVLDATATPPESSTSFQSSSKTLHSSCMCPCDSVKESKGPRRKKTVKTVEYDPRNSASVTHRATNKEPVDSLNAEVGETKWDVSNVLLRPRIFCLQHAIDVKELLCSKGGGHVQVICHSDYLKIKAYAANIAEEIGAELDLDFPLENASQDDLHLINLSIDDEEHQEDGRDWTSKLGINLRFCVKLRKYSESSDEQLPLALNSIFSSSLHVSVVSNLRWLCRKSRTPAKPVGIILEKPQTSTVINRNAPAETSDTSPTKTIQVYQSRRKSPSDTTFRDHNCSEMDLSISEQEANLHRSEEMVPFSENVGNLFTVPISIVGCCGISLNSKNKQHGDLNIAESGVFHLPASPEYASCHSYDSVLCEKNSETIVSVPIIYQYQQHSHNSSDCNCSAMPSGIRSTGEFYIGSGRCKCSEIRVCQGHPESKASGLMRLTGAVVVKGSESELHASVKQCCEHPLLLTTGEDKHVQDIDTAGQNVDASTNFALLAKDHNDVSRLLNDSEMVIEVPMADKVSIASSSFQSKGELSNISLPEDQILKIEIQPLKDKCASVNSGMQQQTCSAEATAFVPLIGSYMSQRSKGNIVVTDVATAFMDNRCPDVIPTRDKRLTFPLNIKSYIRRRNKRKREIEQQTGTPECLEMEKKVEVQKNKGKSEVEARYGGFVRSPCEGLRPRKVKILPDQLEFASSYGRISKKVI